MKFFGIALFFTLLFYSGNAEEVFFVPGWRTGYSSRAGCVRIINYIYPGSPVAVKSWNSAVPYQEAVANAELYAKKLQHELLAMPEQRLRELVIIGHSIGAEIVLETLCVLAEKHLQIKEAVFLGGAFPHDERRIWLALEAVRGRCINIYSPADAVLHFLYPLSEYDAACGAIGWDFSDRRFFETGVKGAMFSFFQHFAYLYLEALGRFRVTLPPLPPEIKLAGELPRPWRRAAVDRVFWHTIESCGKWELQRHCLGNRFRLVDPAGFQRALFSGQSEAQKEFKSLREQLKPLPR